MTTKITPEAVKERIAALESAGELSLKEQFYLEALRQLVAAMDCEPVAENIRIADALEGLLWPNMALGNKAVIQAAIEALRTYHVQPAPVVPEDVLKALQKVARIRLDMDGFDGDRRGIADCLCDAEEALIEVVNRRAAMLQAAPVCTCPSGDGSLRWPCPVHPGNSPVVTDGIELVANTLEHIGNFADAAIIRQLAANQPQNAQQNIPEIIPDSCTWTFSNYDDHWSGTCGVEWIFPDGGPEENGMKFCPKCGKSVAISATE